MDLHGLLRGNLRIANTLKPAIDGLKALPSRAFKPSVLDFI
jgi:hypothetical protein